MILQSATIASKKKKVNLNTFLFNCKIVTCINATASRPSVKRIGSIKLRGTGDILTGIKRMLKVKKFSRLRALSLSSADPNVISSN